MVGVILYLVVVGIAALAFWYYNDRAIRRRFAVTTEKIERRTRVAHARGWDSEFQACSADACCGKFDV